jgi:hypothetical protein
VNQGPRGDGLTKKTEGRKSRATVPLRCHVSWFVQIPVPCNYRYIFRRLLIMNAFQFPCREHSKQIIEHIYRQLFPIILIERGRKLVNSGGLCVTDLGRSVGSQSSGL